MKDFFRTKAFRALLCVILILLALLLYTQNVGNSFLANVISLISSPMQAISTDFQNQTSDSLQDLQNSPEALREKIAALEEENRTYREQLVDFYSYKQKVLQYETILDIQDTNPDLQLLAAAVIGRDPTDLFYGFTIDQGTTDGVAIGDPVITKDGLVGWVSQVYATTAKVTTILSPSTGVGVCAKEKRENGVLSCNIKFADQNLLKLGLLDTGTAVAAGDIVTTTGLGGIFPKDLLVGVVEEVFLEDYDVSKYATVRPYADLKNVRDVFVITDFSGKGEISATDLSSEAAGQ